MVLGTKVFDCHHGVDRHAKQKDFSNMKTESHWVGLRYFIFLVQIIFDSFS